MHYDQYEITEGAKALTYEFVSQGPMGAIPKLIVFSKMELPGFYNLAFGDKDVVTGSFDDAVRTNNSDTFKVMVTVAATVYLFTNHFPNAKVYFEGSSKSRTRLYRMAVANNLEIINLDFDVYGFRTGVWEKFVVETDYEAFVVTRKKL